MSVNISELLVIFLVALLVIKPDRLPEVAMKVGKFVKWMRQTVEKIKTEMDAPLNKNNGTHSNEK